MSNYDTKCKACNTGGCCTGKLLRPRQFLGYNSNIYYSTDNCEFGKFKSGTGKLQVLPIINKLYFDVQN